MTKNEWQYFVEDHFKHNDEFSRATVISSKTYQTLGCSSKYDVAVAWKDKECDNILINENQELLDYKLGKKYVIGKEEESIDKDEDDNKPPKYEMRFYQQCYKILGLNTKDMKFKIDFSDYEDGIECMIARNKKNDNEYLFLKHCMIQNAWIMVTVVIGQDDEEYEFEDMEEAFERFVDIIRQCVDL